MQEMGHVFAWGAPLSLLVVYPIGYLCSRFHAIRILLIALSVMAVLSMVAIFVIHSSDSWVVFYLATIIPGTTWGLAMQTMMLRLFPAEKFGQFFSSINVLGFGSIFIGNYLVGALMDAMHSRYRLVYLVSFACYAAALPVLYLVYRRWIFHGGPHNYVPPAPVEALTTDAVPA